ncbi:MAG: GMC family oxidoreductase [Candidatus Dormibacteraceae bacterium]
MSDPDAVVVGGGWVGGILAAEMTKAGMEVTVLERGSSKGRSTDNFQTDHDELAYAIRYKLMQNAATETQTVRHSLGEAALPMRYLGAWLPGTGWGGAGLHWNGQTWRFTEYDFMHNTLQVQRYGPLPPQVAVQDWGITSAQMEPYYDTFEYMAGIAGKAGNLNGEIIPGGNTLEAPRSREYPVPPMPTAHAPGLFQYAADKLGYHPFPGPSANLPDAYTNPDGISRASCTYCGFCERFGCEVGAKASAVVTVFPVAQKTGKLDLRFNCNVFKVLTSGQQATGVQYHDEKGDVQTVNAPIVVLGAFTFNNLRLLMMSNMGTQYDPNTGQGDLGRNFCYQIGGGGATGFFKDYNFHRYMGSGANSMSMDDFYGDNFDHTGLGFMGGGNISCSASGARPIQSEAAPAAAGSWGAKWKKAIKQYYDNVASVGCQAENIAYTWRMADLDPTYKDQYGTPLLRITYDFADNERNMCAFVAKKCGEIVKEMGADEVAVRGTVAPHFDTTAYQSTHVTGGAIMGAAPGTSTVNNWLQMWNYPNVFVVGASAFPQNPGKNPTGTVSALAYWAADGIINHYRRSPGPITPS